MRLYDKIVIGVAVICIAASLLYVPWMHKAEHWVDVVGTPMSIPPRPAGYRFLNEPMNDGDFINWPRVAMQVGFVLLVAIVAYSVNRPKRLIED